MKPAGSGGNPADANLPGPQDAGASTAAFVFHEPRILIEQASGSGDAEAARE